MSALAEQFGPSLLVATLAVPLVVLAIFFEQEALLDFLRVDQRL